MTRMSRFPLPRGIFIFACSFALIACAQAKRDKTAGNSDTTVSPTKPATQGPGPTPPDLRVKSCSDLHSGLAKLTDKQKQQTLEVLTAASRLGNSLDQLYVPDKSAELDSVEQYILKTLQDYCKVVHDTQKNGNRTDDSFSLSGDACPAKNTRNTHDSRQDAPGSIVSNQSAEDNLQLLSAELTQVVPLSSVVANKAAQQKISMPASTVVKRELSSADVESITSITYGAIPTSHALGISLLNIAVPDGDSVRLGDLIDVTGNGLSYRFNFSDFVAEFRVLYSKTDGAPTMHQEICLNDEPVSRNETTVFQTTQKPTLSRLLGAALSLR